MVLIAGDLFDSAYPPIDTLKETFREFKKLHDVKIPCFIIAGSHDYSVSGKTFLDVLEHAGFCENIYKFEEREGKIILQPTIYNNYALYGYPGMKSGLELEGLRKVVLNEAPGFFKVFVLHTALKEAIGNLPMDSISLNELPKANYYALGHLHVEFGRNDAAYSGPIFPNNFDELEELKHGRFQIVNYSNNIIKRDTIKIKLKEVLCIDIELENTLTATEKIIMELDKNNLADKIILLKLFGTFSNGRISDIRFNEIENFAKNKGCYAFIKNISRLKVEEAHTDIETKEMRDVEDSMIKQYSQKNPSKFNEKIPVLIKSLGTEKQEDEKNQIFQERLFSEIKSILNVNF